eukprot:1677-Heterococcus_DN1.PRE.1
MGEEVPDWRMMWGAKVKMPVDMPDDILHDAIHTSKDALEQCTDFETDGAFCNIALHCYTTCYMTAKRS